jgi:hypothetical protein
MILKRADKAGKVTSMATLALLCRATSMLLERFYLARELAVVVVITAVLVFIGASLVFLAILVQECSRWSIRKFREAKSTTGLSVERVSAVRMAEFAMPGRNGPNPAIMLTIGGDDVRVERGM